jgi:pyruvate formate lyase activating enzyme
MLGCDFHCPYCQNWVASQALRDEASESPIVELSPERIVKAAQCNGARLVVSSYNEPLITAEWAVAVFQQAKSAGFACAFVSNGNATAEALDFLRPWLVAYKVDLKGFDDKRYRTLGGTLEHVTEGIRMVHKRGLWLEVVTLVVPGFNDSEGELRDIARFLASVSRDIPWHVTAFHPDYRMTDSSATPAPQLIRAAEIGAEEGLHFVYAGNLPGRVGQWENTVCPQCCETLITRLGYCVHDYRITVEGKCPKCQTPIPGIWSAEDDVEMNLCGPTSDSLSTEGRGACNSVERNVVDASLKNQPSNVRRAAVAGRFYPGEPGELRRTIESFLAQVGPVDAPTPKAIIAPHAGYSFCGPVAASAYARFASARNLIKRMVLIGPSHFVLFEGLAASSAEAFATPLGIVPVDVEAVRRIRSLPQITILDEAHAREHSLEVHLPFLQMVLNEFSIVPLVVGEATDEQVAGVIDALWNGPSTRFVISSDLSHYHDYVSAQKLDSFTSRAIEQLQPDEIREEHACGRIPIRGWLRAARQHGLFARTIDLRNSGDAMGPRREVVGYGAFVFEDRLNSD